MVTCRQNIDVCRKYLNDMEEVPPVGGGKSSYIFCDHKGSSLGHFLKQRSALIAVGLSTKWSKANPLGIRDWISSKCSTGCAFPICTVLGPLHTDQF